MRFRGLLFLPMAIAITSCINNKPNKKVPPKDTLAYTSQVITERAADCAGKPDSGCTMAVYTYPVFKDHEALNDEVKKVLVNFFNSDQTPDTTLRASAQLFLKAYGNYKRSYPKSTVAFKLKSTTKVVTQDSSLATIDAGIYVFMGTGSGGSIDKYINWDTGANKEITLNDLFIDGYYPQLNKIAEDIFRKEEKLGETAPLTGYHFPKGQFQLNDNFMVTPLGIKFLFNQNEIKPHDAGATILMIPYDTIKSLLRPNTVVNQYVK